MTDSAKLTISRRIRQVRRQQARTLEEIAKACGFTKSLLSKIENGHIVPTVATLTKIAKTLGVGVSALMAEGNDSSTAFQAKKALDDAAFVLTEKGYSFFAFAANRPKNVMQPYLFRAKRGEVRRHALTHPGEEFVYMLEGKMRYRVGASEYTLTSGDSVYFDSTEEHEVTPLSKEALYLAIFVEGAKAPRGRKTRS